MDARVGHLDALVRAALLEWQRRLKGAQEYWQGPFGLAIGDETFEFRVTKGGLERVEDLSEVGSRTPVIARLSPQAFTQLLVGYRPADRVAKQEQEEILESLLPLLTALFTSGNTWIAGTDDF